MLVSGDCTRLLGSDVLAGGDVILTVGEVLLSGAEMVPTGGDVLLTGPADLTGLAGSGVVSRWLHALFTLSIRS